jgi:hypothetical protein
MTYAPAINVTPPTNIDAPNTSTNTLPMEIIIA